jgi:inorganic pyrophosphatase/K(+)-stimulated pyrophosphate-energized sodium pump
VAENVPGTPDQYLMIGGERQKLSEGQWVKLADGIAVKLGDEPRRNTTWMVLDDAAVDGFAKLSSKTVVTAMPTDAAMDELVEGRRVVPIARARMADYMRFYDVTLMNPKVLVGLFIGAMSTFVFCALTMKAVGRAAKGMVEEVRRQFREKPGIMEGSDTPDYAAPVAISTKAAQKEMVLPSLLALVMPLATGLVLGVGGVMGLLVGGLTTGFCLAVFMANAGGAWDNAKKYIESGVHGGKGTEAHKAAVVGDTVGDPFKDTSGPSLNILIKLMSMVSVVAAGLVVRYSLEALGIF